MSKSCSYCQRIKRDDEVDTRYGMFFLYNDICEECFYDLEKKAEQSYEGLKKAVL